MDINGIVGPCPCENDFHIQLCSGFVQLPQPIRKFSFHVVPVDLEHVAGLVRVPRANIEGPLPTQLWQSCHGRRQIPWVSVKSPTLQELTQILYICFGRIVERRLKYARDSLPFNSDHFGNRR